MNTAKSNYANVNGVKMYYEVHGAGEPLILMHGGFGTTEMFADLVRALAETRLVIPVDLQAHGRTADVDRPMSFEAMADDVAALIRALELEEADLLGYSLGGGVAWQTAIRHPELVRKFIAISAPARSDGWYPSDRAGMGMVNGELAKTWTESPMYHAYASVAPRPEDWPVLADKLGQLLRQDYDWTADVAAIRAPVLIVVGDADGVRLEYAVELFRLLGGPKMDATMLSRAPGSQLAVLPGTTHIEMFTRTDLLLPIVQEFLNAPMPEAQVRS